MHKRLEETMVVEEKQRSALYIAKKRDSFARLYSEISKAIIKPALEKLPEEDYVREMIHNGLEEHHESE